MATSVGFSLTLALHVFATLHIPSCFVQVSLLFVSIDYDSCPVDIGHRLGSSFYYWEAFTKIKCEALSEITNNLLYPKL